MSTVKVGDELAFARRYGGWDFRAVESITPTGRIKCGIYTLNPDLTIRGASAYGPYSAQIATDEMRAEMRERHEQAGLIEQILEVQWREKSTDQLRRIVAILDEGAAQ